MLIIIYIYDIPRHYISLICGYFLWRHWPTTQICLRTDVPGSENGKKSGLKVTQIIFMLLNFLPACCWRTWVPPRRTWRRPRVAPTSCRPWSFDLDLLCCPRSTTCSGMRTTTMMRPERPSRGGAFWRCGSLSNPGTGNELSCVNYLLALN